MIKFFKRTYTDEEKRLFEFLRSTDLFMELTDDELYHFVPYIYLRDYKKNEVVFFRNDPSNALYVVKTGTVTISLDIEENLEELARAVALETLGDNSLLPEAKRTYNAIVSSEEAQLYVIPKINLHEIFEDFPRVKAKVLTAFAEDHDQYITNIFNAYRSAHGFFDLRMVYEGK